MPGAGVRKLSALHPLVIEGSALRDPRDPDIVAQHLVGALQAHWKLRPPKSPIVLVTQGDPIEERGISAITRRVAAELKIPRCLVALDESIDPEHLTNADREGVQLELRFSELAALLGASTELDGLKSGIDSALGDKNAARTADGKPNLPSYYYDYALLQEVVKSACKKLCGGALTFAHTMPVDEIFPLSVTSFYTVGLAQGLYDAADLVAYPPPPAPPPSAATAMRAWHLSESLNVLIPSDHEPIALGPSMASYVSTAEALPLLPYAQHGEEQSFSCPLTREKAAATKLHQQQAHDEAVQGRSSVRGYAHWLSISSWDAQRTLVIQETFRHTGTRIWRGALLHRAWAMHNSNLFVDKSVLEVGSGTGILGLSIAVACKPTSVTLSDFRGHFQSSETVMHLLRDNVVDNMALAPAASVIELDWSRPTKPLRWALQRGEEAIVEECACATHQCVIGTEVLYSIDGAALLAALLPSVLERPGGVAYVLNNKHRAGVPTFPAECKRHGLHCEEIGWAVDGAGEEVCDGATWTLGTSTATKSGEEEERDEFVHFRVAWSE